MPPKALRLSQTSSRWLRVVADHYEMPLPVMASQLGTVRALAYEAARLLHAAARREAEGLVGRDGKPPEGADLFDRLTRAYYNPLMETKREASRAKTRAVLDAEIRQQQKRARAEKKPRNETKP